MAREMQDKRGHQICCEFAGRGHANSSHSQIPAAPHGVEAALAGPSYALGVVEETQSDVAQGQPVRRPQEQRRAEFVLKSAELMTDCRLGLARSASGR